MRMFINKQVFFVAVKGFFLGIFSEKIGGIILTSIWNSENQNQIEVEFNFDSY